MKRLLLSLTCCLPLLFSPSISFALTGQNEVSSLSYEQYGPIRSTETLWSVSKKLRPNNSVSVQQTLVAIYKTNPYAFENGDINKIIAESVIKVPPLQLVQQQTNREAITLINKYSSKKAVSNTSTPKPAAIKPTTTKTVEEKVDVEPTLNANAEVASLFAELTADEAQLVEQPLDIDTKSDLEQQLKALKAEVDLLNQQYIEATQATELLKLKLQPFNEQINSLSNQLDAELAVQAELQKVIDDYRTQLESIEQTPHSGDGMINQILKTISSSLTNLLIVILAPIVLLLIIFVFISRARSKDDTFTQEQAFSAPNPTLATKPDALANDNTPISKQEEVDTLLADNNVSIETINNEDSQHISNKEQSQDVVNLANSDELTNAIDKNEHIDAVPEDKAAQACSDLNDEQSAEYGAFFGVKEVSNSQTSVTATENDDVKSEKSEYDSFFDVKIEKASETTDKSIEIDDRSFIASEDDAFYIETVKDSETADKSIEIDDEPSIASEDNAFYIETVKDSETTDKSIEIDDEPSVASKDDAFYIETVKDSETADKSIEIDDGPSEVSEYDSFFDINTAKDSETADKSIEIDDLQSEKSEDDAFYIESEEDTVTSAKSIDLDFQPFVVSEDDVTSGSVVQVNEQQLTQNEPDNDNPAAILDDQDNSEQPESVSSTNTRTSTGYADFDLEHEWEAKTSSDSLSISELDLLLENDLVASDPPDSALNLEIKDDTESFHIDDLDKFAEDVSDTELELVNLVQDDTTKLHEIDESKEIDFIDIETLLESSGAVNKDEPYTELNLDLGLDEFPDVVDLQESVDIDDDENGISAHLDLARAYLEIDDKAGAKKILMSVYENSDGKQRAEIDKLLSRIS